MSQKPLVYLAGPMTGHEQLNYPAFEKWAKTLRGSGNRVCNPIEINNCREIDPNAAPYDNDVGLKMTALQDISLVAGCQGIKVMPGSFNVDLWRQLTETHKCSKGALAEVAFAQWIGLQVDFLMGT